MTTVDANDLAMRMRRIRELTATLLAVQTENERVRTLAEHVAQEIAVARLQIRLYTPQIGVMKE